MGESVTVTLSNRYRVPVSHQPSFCGIQVDRRSEDGDWTKGLQTLQVVAGEEAVHVGGELILETTFLVDLERETIRGESGPTHRFLEARPEARLCVTLTTAGEMAAGMGPDDRSLYHASARARRTSRLARATCPPPGSRPDPEAMGLGAEG